jgi:hypothetical protein
MTFIEIEFEKGGCFTARLLCEEAPKTYAAIVDRLPFVYTFHQSVVSGQAMLALLPDLTVPRENQRTLGLPPGSLCFLVQNPPMNVPDEIYISYGPYFVPRSFAVDAQEPVNVFGQVESGLDNLLAVGKRVLMKGAEEVRFTVAEETRRR